jgi:TonB-linked SusC/RagA family outer membrane protein
MTFFHNFFCEALAVALRYPKRVLVLLLCLAQLQAVAQSIKISGKVLDENGAPLVGASVVVKGTTVGVMVGAEGTYTISAAPTATLIFSFVGYPNVEMPVNNQTTIDVSMSTEGEEIEEIVVVGYGTVKRANVTGAVSSLNASELQDIPTMNLSTALEGKLAGVKIGQSSGKPGASTSLTIRQSTSYGDVAETPLYVIDGVIRDKDAFDILDPSEMESISILKDASAAVYGARAAAGVVLVQTKRGKQGKLKVSYNGTYGLTQSVRVPKMLNAYEQAQMLEDGLPYRASGTDPKDYTFTPAEKEYFKSLPGGGYNWLEEAWQDAHLTRHSLNLSGGTERVRYFVGGSYFYQTGNFQGLKVDKSSVRGNLEFDIVKGLTASVSLSLDSKGDRTPMNPADTQGDLMEETFKALLQAPQWVPPAIQGYPVHKAGSVTINNNPYAMWESGNYKEGSANNSNTTFGLSYKIPFIEGLSARAQYSQTKGSTYDKTYYTNSYSYDFGIIDSLMPHVILPTQSPSTGTPIQINTKRYLEESANHSKNYQVNLSLSYSKIFGEHDVNALLVCEFGEGESGRIGVQRNGEPLVPNVDMMWALSENSDRALASTPSTSGNLGYIGRLNYSYGKRYVGEFSFRYEASTKFAPENRWGFFPAGAVGWIISEENFFKENVNFIDFFKLRASAGLLGNDGVRPYSWSYLFGSKGSSLPMFGSSQVAGAIEAKNLGIINRNISWQKTQSYNLGADVKVWDNKISVGGEVFYKYTYDILAQLGSSLPTTTGAGKSNIRFNYGIMCAYGYEIELGYYDKLPFDISYYVKGNFAWSEAMKLKVDQSPGAIGTWRDQLKNPGDNQPGAVDMGIIRTQEQLDDILAEDPDFEMNGEKPELGMLYYKDLRDSEGVEGPNGKFDFSEAEDRTIIAMHTSAPYTYGISVGLSWKGLKLDMTFVGDFGHYVFFDKPAMEVAELGANALSFWADHWTPQNTDAAFPRAYDYGLPGNYSTFWRRNGATFTLNDLNLSYTLPNKIAEVCGLAQLRVFCSTKNLWTMVNPFDYKDASTSNYNAYPMTRVYNFGLNFTL